MTGKISSSAVRASADRWLVRATVGMVLRLGFPHTLNAQQPYHGVVDSKEAAKRAFAERWRTQQR